MNKNTNKTMGTFFQNSEEEPLKYGEVNIINPHRKRLRGELEKVGVEVHSAFLGFCGTDNELMKMGKENSLHHKFPKGENRLINGHEGVVWVPDESRFAVVLIRGGDSYDPTRFTEEESYFEYGCDGADGLFSDRNYYHPDMLLHLPKKYETLQKLPVSLAKRLVFCDPYACAIFQLERMEDIGMAQNFRVEMAKHKCDKSVALELAKKNTFNRVVIFGLGTTGLFIGDQIRRSYPNADILFVARSASNTEKVKYAVKTVKAKYLSVDGMNESESAKAIVEKLGGTATAFVGVSGTNAEHRIAFKEGVLGCNGIYNSFSLGPNVTYDTMPFGFKNHVILSSINFRQSHMEKAIDILCDSTFDQIVGMIDKDEFVNNPMEAYENKIFSKSAPLKTAVIWNKNYMEM